MEEFKIINYKGIDIEVGNFGTIKIDGQIKTQRLDGDGYLVIQPYINSKRVTILVHRVVALAFIPNDNPTDKTEVNHKDFNRANPRWDNLEWISHKDNVRYSHKEGHYAKPHWKGENNPNYGNHKLSEIYRDNPELALEKQSRKGAINGMSKKVKLYVDDVYIKTFNYIGELASYLKDNYGLKAKLDTIRNNMRVCHLKGKKYLGKYSYELCD